MNQNNHYIRYTLSNDVRLIMIPMAGITSLANSVMVGVGSRHEHSEINGISHFLEHMVFKGTKKYPTTEDVNAIERIGGIQNAYTDIDLTSYHNKVFSNDWKHAMDINKELALYPRLKEEFVEKERDVILEEMKRYEDQPAAKVEEQFHMMLYPNTKLGMRIIGEEASLRSIIAETIRTYHQNWYTPDRMAVVVAGRITKEQEKKIKETVTRWYGGLHKPAKKLAERVVENQTAPVVRSIVKNEAQQAHLCLGVRIFPRHHEDRFAWAVFNLLMGVGFTSRLFKEVREKRGLCYHVTSKSDIYEDVGSWHVYAGVATDKVEEAIQAILAEFHKAIHGVSEAEVSVAKKRLRTAVSFKSENPEFVSEFYGRQEIFEQPIMTLEKYLTRIGKVTKQEVDQVVKKYITMETLNLSIVWNKKGQEERLERLLKL